MSTAVKPYPQARPDPTIAFYDRNAADYAEATLPIDMEEIYNRFLRHVPSGGLLLDAGSGAGRDTLAFVDRGFAVDAFDASPELCAISTELTGVPARVLRFQEFESPSVYDGIWACASLLHVPAAELVDALGRLIAALKSGGAFYLSFKHGDAERVAADGRFFRDMDEQTLRALIAQFREARIAELWVSAGEGTQKGRAEWLNAVLIKQTGAEG